MSSRKRKITAASEAPPPPHSQSRFSLSPPGKDGIAIAFMVLAAALFYWPIVSLQGTMWNDFIEQYFPYRTFATRALRHGVFPFWNPYSFSGMPFFADIQSAVLYPLNLLLVPFGGPDGIGAVLFEYQIILHIMLAGVFTYALARDFRRSRTASLLAGLVYMLGGFATAHIFHVTMIHALPWFALSLLTLRRALLRSNLYYAVATAFLLCFVAFAGHPQMYVYLHYFLGAYLLFHLIEQFRSGATLKRTTIPAAFFLLSVLLGSGLSSVQLLPTSRLSRESVRPELEFDKSAQGSFRPYRFITLIAPNFFSTPNNLRKKAPVYWGKIEKDIDPGAHYYWETALYLGVLPLILALMALFVSRQPPVMFLGSVALGAFLIAMGDAAPFYKLAYTLLPGFRLFRNPARIGIIFSLAMSLLAAYGIDWLFTEASSLSRNKRWKGGMLLACFTGVFLLASAVFSTGVFKPAITRFIIDSGILGDDGARIEGYVSHTVYPFTAAQLWICAVFAVISFGVAAGRLYRKVTARCFSLLLPAILLCDLLLFGYGFAAMKNDPRKIYEKTRLIRSVQEENEKGIFRINSRGSLPGSDEIGGPYLIFRRNEGTVHSICLMEGYNPLRLKRQLMDRKDRTLDILNIRYKIDVNEQSSTMSIIPHPTCLPRARMVPSYRLIPDEKRILPTLHDPGFDHVNEVILEEKPDFVPAGRRAPGNASARIVSWSINRIVTDVSIDRPALLVMSEIFYPAWKATIDGEKAAVLRANYALRAIAVPAGKHTVVCRYDDDAFSRGLAVTLASLFAAIGLVAWRFFTERRGRKESVQPPAITD
ncbi:MAG: hypothetical protein JXA18_11985 [Chitinispirillaceae bacterium]|nr:hypothetical protein [Chitinispirillaceae bacterium]